MLHRTSWQFHIFLFSKHDIYLQHSCIFYYTWKIVNETCQYMLLVKIGNFIGVMYMLNRFGFEMVFFSIKNKSKEAHQMDRRASVGTQGGLF